MNVLTIRPLSRSELDIGIDWAAAEGWNPGLHDADSFHAADPQGFLVALLGDEPVGMISAVRYGRSFGFIGFYIVRPAYRGRGHGLALWQAGMQALAGRLVGLDGVVAQQHNYRRSGFSLAWNNLRCEGLPMRATGPDAGHRAAGAAALRHRATLRRRILPGRPQHVPAPLDRPARQQRAGRDDRQPSGRLWRHPALPHGLQDRAAVRRRCRACRPVAARAGGHGAGRFARATRHSGRQPCGGGAGGRPWLAAGVRDGAHVHRGSRLRWPSTGSTVSPASNWGDSGYGLRIFTRMRNPTGAIANIIRSAGSPPWSVPTKSMSKWFSKVSSTIFISCSAR